MYLYGGYEPVPDAPYISSYEDETYNVLYGGNEPEDDDFYDYDYD